MLASFLILILKNFRIKTACIVFCMNIIDGIPTHFAIAAKGEAFETV